MQNDDTYDEACNYTLFNTWDISLTKVKPVKQSSGKGVSKFLLESLLKSCINVC